MQNEDTEEEDKFGRGVLIRRGGGSTTTPTRSNCSTRSLESFSAGWGASEPAPAALDDTDETGPPSRMPSSCFCSSSLRASMGVTATAVGSGDAAGKGRCNDEGAAGLVYTPRGGLSAKGDPTTAPVSGDDDNAGNSTPF